MGRIEFLLEDLVDSAYQLLVSILLADVVARRRGVGFCNLLVRLRKGVVVDHFHVVELHSSPVGVLGLPQLRIQEAAHSFFLLAEPLR